MKPLNADWLSEPSGVASCFISLESWNHQDPAGDKATCLASRPRNSNPVMKIPGLLINFKKQLSIFSNKLRNRLDAGHFIREISIPLTSWPITLIVNLYSGLRIPFAVLYK